MPVQLKERKNNEEEPTTKSFIRPTPITSWL